MGLPLNHPSIDGLSLINHPFWGSPIYGTIPNRPSAALFDPPVAAKASNTFSPVICSRIWGRAVLGTWEVMLKFLEDRGIYDTVYMIF
jgi:hypothetical protein